MIDRPAGVQHELPIQHNIGALNEVCIHCHERHFACERAAVTGHRVFFPAPELLMSLLVDDSREARHFRTEIRHYNNTLTFAAFSSDLNPRRLPGRGPRVFTVHGQVYRRITNNVVRNNQSQSRFCELYFVEPATANQIRMQQQSADIHCWKI